MARVAKQAAGGVRQVANGGYNASQLKALKGLEPVRQVPGMYIGSTDGVGLQRMLREIVDNAIDEAMAGFCTRVDIVLHKDDSASVDDNGRGIPVDINKEEKMSGLQMVMTLLHGGGKFNQEDSAYKVSGGMHGVGASVVNALSTKMVAEVRRDKKLYRQEYVRGIPTGDVEVVGKSVSNGTMVRFWPDPEIFSETEFSKAGVMEWLRQVAYLNSGLLIGFEDERDGTKHRFFFEGGIPSMVRHLNAEKKTICRPFMVAKTVEGTQIEIALQYQNTTYAEHLLSFVNNINTSDGGAHVTGFRTALTSTLNRYGRKVGILKDAESNLSGDDVREGLTAVITIRMARPLFESQSKTKFSSNEVTGRVSSVFSEAFLEFLEKSPQEAKKIIEQCTLAQRARTAAMRQKDLVQRKTLLENTTLPGKLADCTENDPKECEIYIVEGDSAGGTAKSGRDRKFQAILPLRGKILNVEKARVDKMLGNEEIKNLITAMGAGFGRTLDVSKLRYHRVIIASVDGNEHTLIKDDKGVRMVKIGQHIDEQLEGFSEEDSGYSKRRGGQMGEVLAYDQKHSRLHFAPVAAVIRHKIDEPLFKLRTRYGREVQVTASHSVYVFDNGELVLKKGSDLQVGDLVAIPKSVHLPDSASARINLLRALWSIPAAAQQTWLRGEGVREWFREKIRAEHANSPGLVEPRMILTGRGRDRMVAARLESRLTQKELSVAAGVKQPCSYYSWEKGDARPTASQFDGYISAIGLSIEVLAGDVSVGPSRLERNWSEIAKGSDRNRVRGLVRLCDLQEEDVRWFTNRDDVVLSPEKYSHMVVSTHLEVSKELLYLMGFYMAEGSGSPRSGFRLAIGNRNKLILESLQEKIRTVFGKKATWIEPTPIRVGELRLLNRVQGWMWQELFGFSGARSGTKKIPDLVFNVSEELRLEFLRGYFDGDGTSSARAMFFSSTSRDIASGLQYLLASLEVVAGVHETLPDGKVSLINGRECITRSSCFNVAVTSPADIWRLETVWSGHPNADALRNYLTTSKSISRPGWKEIGENLIAVPIVAIEPVEASGQYVYDYSVEGDENFIAGFGGVLCHNTDADVDGSHIRTLLLTFFWRHLQPVITGGFLYLAQPPLFKLEKGAGKNRQVEYAFNDEERDKFLKKMGPGKVDVARYKGLGEMNADQLWETTMDPATRTLIQMTVEDAIRADEIFDKLMGPEVAPRKRFIQTHAKAVRNLDI